MGENTRRPRRLARIGVAAGLVGALLPVAAFVETAHAAIRVWDGDGGNQLWSNGGNWVGGTAPVAGDDLVFPAGVSPGPKPTQNDLGQGFAIASITIADEGYTLFGHGVTTTTVTTTHASGQVNISLGNGDSGYIVPGGQTLTITVGAGGEVISNANMDLAGRPIVLDVDGTLNLFAGFVNTPGSVGTRTGSGTVLFTGGGFTPAIPWDVQSGTSRFAAASHGALVNQTGGTVTGASAFVNGYSGSGGLLTPGTTGSDVGQLTWQGDLSIGSGATYGVDINGSNAPDRDQLFANGAVTLGGTLTVDAAGFVPTDGLNFTIINKTTAGPVANTFAGLAEGASVPVNGGQMTISYVGGDGNDVTLSTPPAYVWDGEAANDNWTTPTNWVGDVAPPPNTDATLEFPNAADKNVVNDFPAGSAFGNIVFSFADYVISGQPFEITEAVVSTAGANFNTIAADVEFTQNGAISIPTPGVQIRFTGAVVIDNGAVIVSGGGFAQLSGSLTGVGGLLTTGPGGGALLSGNLSGFFGVLTIDAGYVQVDGTMGATSNVTVNTGGTLAGSGTVGNTVANGGTIQPNDITPPGAVLGVGNLTMQQPSTLSVDVDAITPGVGHDQLTVTGTVTLAGTLQTTAAVGPPLDQVLTIIANDGADAVVGTFAGLPEGASVVVNAIPMLISYVGGTGNDVTLSTTASVWDGGGVDGNWMTAANWVGDVAPVPSANRSLVFPDGALQKTNVNNFPAGSAFKDVLLTGSAYFIGGNSIALAGGVIGANTTGANAFAPPLTLGGNRTFTQATGGELGIGSTITIGNGNTLTLAGGGNHTLTAGLIDGALTKIGAGLATVSLPSALDGPITVTEGTFRLDGDTAAAVVVNGGSLVGSGQTGPITMTAGGVGPGFITKGVITASSFSASGTSGTGFDVDGNDPGNTQDQVVVNGTVSLGGFLSVSSIGVPPLNQSIVLIANDGADAVVGTFNGIPEGGTVMVSGTYEARVSYVGGTGNDVSMFVPPTFTWDGGGADSKWSTPSNWQTDVAPTGAGGETLVFPTGASQTANQNDIANATFEEIRFTGPGYVVAGLALDLAVGVTATNVNGSNTYVVPTDALADLTVAQSAGGTLSLGLIDLNGGVLHVTGAGAHNGGDQITNGDIDVSAVGSGSVTFSGSLPTLGGSVFLNSGLLVVDGDLAGDVQVAGGRLEGDGGAAGLVATAGVVAPGGAATAVFNSTATLDLDAASTFEADLATPTPGTGHDQIATTGNVSLGASLAVTLTGPVAAGDQFTIIDNGSANPVSATFAGLADGAVFVAGAVPFTVDYQGGDGNDVVLTAGPHVSLSTAAVALAEGGLGGSTSAGLSVLLDQAVVGDVVVHVAVTGGSAAAGADVSALDTNLTIPGGSTSVAVPLNVLGDDLVEPDETVEVTLTVVSGAALAPPTVATVTITNDDAATITVPNPQIVITEGGPGSMGLALAATSQLVLALDHPSSSDIGVHIATADGTATSPADYAGFDQVFTIPAGTTSFVVPLTIVDDNVDEPDETFTVRVLGATGAALAPTDLTVTLVDNDPTPPPPTTTTPPGGPTTTVDPGTLPETGGSPMGPLTVGAVLVGLGAVLALARRRLLRPTT